ncbi:hypothetical protein PWT90_05858 [Aphanocladium album]|nr:hypothetical protein PWT90_05858 [Aphanocladium album]
MFSFAQAALLAWLSAGVAGAPSTRFLDVLIHEQVNVPASFEPIGYPDPDAVLQLKFGLRQKDIGGLQRKLMDISNHNSPNYGQWLSKQEIAAFTRPSDSTLSLVKAWLEESGVSALSIDQTSPDWLTVNVPIKTAERMLSAEYSVYKETARGSSLIRTPKYSIPKLLQDHIDTIQPTTAFMQQDVLDSNEGVSDSAVSSFTGDCASLAAPPCVRDFYHVDYHGNGSSSVAVTEFGARSASETDLAQFLREYDPNTKAADFKIISVGGGNNTAPVSVEPALDTQLAASYAAPNPAYLLAVGPSSFTDALTNLATFLNSEDQPPSTVSTSYSISEAAVSKTYATRLCNEFAKAGARGISIFFSSGDYGVGNKDQSCSSFVTHFPVVCPYITAVGATSFSSGGGEEVAVWSTTRATGGGFSNLFDTPDYQKNDTAAFLSTVPGPYKKRFRTEGRGYPDVSLIGTAVPIVLGGQNKKGTGTSASAPSWAALIALINDSRISLGKPALGFLNPRLYGDEKVRAALNDITNGHNGGCGTDGFTAVKGWDAASGLGTMNFAALRAAFSI